MKVARALVVSIVVGLSVGCAACTGSSAPKGSPVSTSVAGTPSPTRTPSPSSSAPAKAPKPTATATLGGECASVLPQTAVDQAVGRLVLGQTAFIVNIPDATIGQIERIDCQYGLAAAKKGQKAPVAPIEVSVSLYASSALAAKRIVATEEEWRQDGAIPHPVKVGTHPAVVLTGNGNPLLIVAVGPRTVAADMLPSVVKANRVNSVLAALADSALRGAGG